MSNVQNQQDSIYKSLQQFLFRKNLITQAVLAMARDSGELWNNTFDEAYKSFATHRLGIHSPQIPATVFQVDPRILEDADWVFLDQEDAGAGAHAVPATTRESQFQEQTQTQAVQYKTGVSNTENTGLNEFVSTPLVDTAPKSPGAQVTSEAQNEVNSEETNSEETNNADGSSDNGSDNGSDIGSDKV